MRRLNPFKKSFSNFTIIEMIMVITILSILLILAVNRFSFYYGVKLELAGKKLVADIRYVQALAIAEHRELYIEFIPSLNKYEVYRKDLGSKIYYVHPYTKKDFIVDFSLDSEFKGVSLNSASFDGTNILRFSSLGEPKNGNGNPLLEEGVVVLNYKDNEVKVVVYPKTGFCKLE
ncbi:MAG: hypothetical protein NC904_02745 [Candidatus Omnitrophica bacterium]|nr:hypothetical protein [Candidatus Omnitrophota bacterium]